MTNSIRVTLFAIIFSVILVVSVLGGTLPVDAQPISGADSPIVTSQFLPVSIDEAGRLLQTSRPPLVGVEFSSPGFLISIPQKSQTNNHHIHGVYSNDYSIYESSQRNSTQGGTSNKGSNGKSSKKDSSDEQSSTDDSAGKSPTGSSDDNGTDRSNGESNGKSSTGESSTDESDDPPGDKESSKDGGSKSSGDEENDNASDESRDTSGASDSNGGESNGKSPKDDSSTGSTNGESEDTSGSDESNGESNDKTSEGDSSNGTSSTGGSNGQDSANDKSSKTDSSTDSSSTNKGSQDQSSNGNSKEESSKGGNGADKSNGKSGDDSNNNPSKEDSKDSSSNGNSAQDKSNNDSSDKNPGNGASNGNDSSGKSNENSGDSKSNGDSSSSKSNANPGDDESQNNSSTNNPSNNKSNSNSTPAENKSNGASVDDSQANPADPATNKSESQNTEKNTTSKDDHVTDTENPIDSSSEGNEKSASATNQSHDNESMVLEPSQNPSNSSNITDSSKDHRPIIEVNRSAVASNQTTSPRNQSSNISGINVAVSNVTENTSVTVDIPEDDSDSETTDVAFNKISLTTKRDDDFTLNITISKTRLNGTPTFSNQNTPIVLSHIRLLHSIKNKDVSNVTFVMRVSKDRLNSTTVKPQHVQLYRFTNDSWIGLPTKLSSESDHYYYYNVSSPGLSEFAAGAKQPKFVLQDPELSHSATMKNTKVHITSRVLNTGGADGIFTARLILDGNTITHRQLTIAAGGTRQVTFERSFTEPGSYTVSINRVLVGNITVITKDLINSQNRSFSNTLHVSNNSRPKSHQNRSIQSPTPTEYTSSRNTDTLKQIINVIQSFIQSMSLLF